MYSESMSRLANKHILVTAGPTYEAIDPVRFIGNRSSGKMGIQLVRSLLNYGAKVHLVIGPVSIEIPQHQNLTIAKVESAEEMYQAVMSQIASADIGIFSAAVADYTPVEVAQQKIKKNEERFTIELKKTKDIIGEVGKIKRPEQVLVGFALETNNEEEHAKQKIVKKNLDFIVLNSLNDAGAGFKHDTNKIKIIDKHNNITHFELKNKSEVAEDIVLYLEKKLNLS